MVLYEKQVGEREALLPRVDIRYTQVGATEGYMPHHQHMTSSGKFYDVTLIYIGLPSAL